MWACEKDWNQLLRSTFVLNLFTRKLDSLGAKRFKVCFPVAFYNDNNFLKINQINHAMTKAIDLDRSRVL